MFTSLSVDQQDLKLRAAIYSVLLRNRIDKADWKGALELLDRAVGDTPCSRQQLWVQLAHRYWQTNIYKRHLSVYPSRVLQRQRILVKARQGGSIITDVRKLQKGGETDCSSLWHQAALCAVNVTQQLAYYKNAITSPMVFSLFSLYFYILLQIWFIFSSVSSELIREVSIFWNIFFPPLTHGNSFHTLYLHRVENNRHYNIISHKHTQFIWPNNL